MPHVRVVIDGLALRADGDAGADHDPLGPTVARLLQVWSHPHDDDEVHLVVGSMPPIAIPDWVTVHEVSPRRRGAFGRHYARLFRVPRLCRSLKAHVLLGLRHTGKLATLACPRRTVVYDVFEQHEAPSTVATASLLEPDGRLAWLAFAGRLRLHLIDAVARADWAARRRPLHPAFLRPTGLTPAAAPSLITRLLQSVHPRRSVRWIVAASASTLAISAAAAASVDLAVSHSIPVSTPHQLTTPNASHSLTVGGNGSSSPGGVPLPAPTPSSTSTTSSASTTTATSSSTPAAATSPSGPSSTSSSPAPVTVPSLPVLTLPTLTLPTIPSLPGITCATSPTQTTSPLQSIINLCNLGTGGLPLGSK